MTARPSGAVWEPPSPIPIAIGSMPKIIAPAVIRIARSLLPAPSRAASTVARLSCRERSENVTSLNFHDTIPPKIGTLFRLQL